jgi:fatty-acyl-CoA synthase
VVFRAPWLTQGYYKSPEKTKDLWRNGYLHSGDVGHIDAEGYLQITDRIKDVIKTGGEWICSLDLENILSQHEAVLESAAIGVPDAKWGERPMMLVVLKEMFRGLVTEGDLKAYMKQAAKRGGCPATACRTPSSCWTPCRRPVSASSTRNRCAWISPSRS